MLVAIRGSIRLRRARRGTPGVSLLGPASWRVGREGRSRLRLRDLALFIVRVSRASHRQLAIDRGKQVQLAYLRGRTSGRRIQRAQSGAQSIPVAAPYAPLGRSRRRAGNATFPSGWERHW
eukprot:scaffold726_cov262-Pinguiococcus_pyrenoidosus.AAC.13